MGETLSEGDAYAQRARYLPGLLALAPAWVVVTAAGWQDAKLATALISLAGTVGLPVVLRSVVRQQGKRYDVDRLPGSDGMWTTTRMMLPVPDDPVADAHNARRRETVARATGVPLADELPGDGPGRAAAIAGIEQAVADVRRRTRDSGSYPLLAAENAEYGMWRNLYGFRTVGVAVSSVSVVAAAVLAILGATDALDLGTAELIAGGAAAAVFGVLWLLVPTQERIRLAAEAYAVALFDAALGLEAPSSPPPGGARGGTT